MFSPYAFYFPWLLYFLLVKTVHSFGFVLALANNVFPRFQKRQMEKKLCSFSWHAVFLWFMKLASSAFATVFMQHFVRKIKEALFTSFLEKVFKWK